MPGWGPVSYTHLEGKEGLLDEDVLLVSNRSVRNPSFAKFLRLRQLSELEEVGFSADPGEIVLLHSGASIPAGLRVSGSLVAVASPEAFVSFCSAFDNLPVRAAELSHLRDRMFEAFLGSYDPVSYTHLDVYKRQGHMSDIDHARGLCEFVDGCPSMFHTTARIARRLVSEGFAELPEGDAWEVVPGGRYFTRRNNSSVIAFAGGKDCL